VSARPAPRPAPRADLREILFVELLGGLGDLLIALPAIHRLADSYPGARVRVLTFGPGGQLPAAEAADPRYMVTDLWRRPDPAEAVGARFVRLLSEDGWIHPDATRPGSPPAGQVELTGAERAQGHRLLAAALGSAPVRAPALLVPDAGMAVKRWPAARWRALAAALADQGVPTASVPTPGSAGSVSLDGAAGGLGVGVLAPVPLRLLGAVFAAVAELDGVAIAADTGPARLAAAVGAATVALFGPTTAARYGLGWRDLQGLPACPVRRPLAITEQECWWSARCPLDDREPACLADISPATVLAAARELLGSAVTRRPARRPARRG